MCDRTIVTDILEMQRRGLALRNPVFITTDEEEQPAANELRECDIVAAIAAEIASRAMKRATESAMQSSMLGLPGGAYGAAHILQSIGPPIFDWMMALRDFSVGSGNLPAWLARTVPDSMEGRRTRGPGQNVVNAIADVWDEIAALQESVGRLSVAGIANDVDEPLPHELEATVPPYLLALAAELARRVPEGGIPSNRAIGNVVHAILQLHYRLSHPADCILTEARMWGPCATTSGTLRPAAYQGANIEASIWAYAMATSRRGQRRPDVVNLTTREVWEIKPRNRIVQGLLELWGIYLGPANLAIRIYNRRRGSPGPGLEEYRPGSLWRPYPFYVLGGDRIIWVHSEIPGLWYYDVIDVRRVPRRLPVFDPTLALVIAISLALLMNPIPGDEAVLIPAFARSAGFIRPIPVPP